MTNLFKNLAKVLFLLFILLNMFSCTKQTQRVEITKGIFKSTNENKSSKGIIIIPGDTLVTLSKKYDTTISELIKANGLKPPYVLRPGKKIIIPKSEIYEIKKNDTFFSIARCFKLSTKDIKDKNKNLDEKKLLVGKKILLPFYAKRNYCKSKIISKKSTKKNKSFIRNSIFYWPTKGKVIATFGAKKGGRRNDGINILAPRGNPVRAAASGKVIYRGNELPAWGNLILIKHSNGWTSAYAHLDKFYVKIGDNLNAGDLIGVVGQTGNIDKNQLHFQIRKNSKPIDPMRYLKKNNE